MQISPINNQNSNNFRAINKKYFDWAKKDIDARTCVSANWAQMFGYEIFLFRRINKSDGIDTANAVKKYMEDKGYRESLSVQQLLNALNKMA